MSAALAELLIYTIGVKCRGINKKMEYAVEHMFSLSEKAANKMLKQGSIYYMGGSDDDGNRGPESAKGGMRDLIKHTQGHLVRIYPKGLRLRSTNYEPHRYWAAGAQLVALNWQTFGILHISIA
jgi:phosphatidylinositol phospholipase C delta